MTWHNNRDGLAVATPRHRFGVTYGKVPGTSAELEERDMKPHLVILIVETPSLSLMCRIQSVLCVCKIDWVVVRGGRRGLGVLRWRVVGRDNWKMEEIERGCVLSTGNKFIRTMPFSDW